ncbi:MAG: hypothetical protein GXP33_13245 [Spirochaetes bacterium]|nr:hypothetical protein [Spirochaetota bacterium]
MNRNSMIRLIVFILLMSAGCFSLSAADKGSQEADASFQFLPVWIPGPLFTENWWKGTYGLGFEKFRMNIFGVNITFFSIGYSISPGGITIPVGPDLQADIEKKDGIFNSVYTDSSFNIFRGFYLRAKLDGMLGKLTEYSFAEATAGALWNGEDSLNFFKQKGIELSGNIIFGLSGGTSVYSRANGRISYYMPVIKNDLIICPTVWLDGNIGSGVPLIRTPVYSLLPRTEVYNPLSSYSKVYMLSDFTGIVNLSIKKKLFTLYKEIRYETDPDGLVKGKKYYSFNLWMSLSLFAGFINPPGSNLDDMKFKHGYGITVILVDTFNKKPASYSFSFSLFFNENVFGDLSNMNLSGHLSTNPFKVSTWM